MRIKRTISISISIFRDLEIRYSDKSCDIRFQAQSITLFPNIYGVLRLLVYAVHELLRLKHCQQATVPSGGQTTECQQLRLQGVSPVCFCAV